MKFSVNIKTYFLVIVMGWGVAACGDVSSVDQYQSRYFNRGSFGQMTPCGHYGCSIDY